MTPDLRSPLPGLPSILAPRAARDRIAVLDILRGIAILLILLVNITGMGGTIFAQFGDPRLLGWDARDRVCWWLQAVLIDGTQRGLLQVLFGAGALILLGRAMRPDGPVEAADIFYRRTLWLALFGLLNNFVLLWPGDILLTYAVAALFLFPFRRLRPRSLMIMIALYVAALTLPGIASYRHAAAVHTQAAQARSDQNAHRPLTPSDKQGLAAQARTLARTQPAPALFQSERAARLGSLAAYSAWWRDRWFKDFIAGGILPFLIIEAFFTMLFGMALFKLGITQGERSTRFYLWLGLFCYVGGLSARALGASQHAAFDARPNIGSITGELARLAVTTGHIALINLLVRCRPGRVLLAPFKAAGRTAFSLYLMQSLVGDWILFPGIGFGLWGRFHWFGLTMLALAVSAAQLLLANLWLRFFAIGPLEWLWRSLTYQQLQPLRHRARQPDPVLV